VTTAAAPAKAKQGPKVTAQIIELHFRQDHTAGGDVNKKLIRPSAGDFKDATSVFTKPEWNNTRSDPASYTKDTVVVVDLVLQLTISPPGKTVNLTRIRGASAEESLNFDKTLSQTAGAGQTILYWVGAYLNGAAKKLPNSVQKIQGDIAWTLTADGNDISIGATGKHTLYVTYDTPIGKMRRTAAGLEQTGDDQDVTEERLNYSVSAAAGENTEKGCCKGIYNKFDSLGLSYSLGNRWPDTAGGISFHNYLWKEANKLILGECHMLAAAFILACRILGVKGSLQIGYIFPWARRDGADPYNARSSPVHGKYNAQDRRVHIIKRWWPRDDINHGDERLCFTDSNGGNNNFEGVACLDNKTLYPIGEGILDSEATADANADKWYREADFDLFFSGSISLCDSPYPSAVTKTRFKWKD
jgi:hypothetical protein